MSRLQKVLVVFIGFSSATAVQAEAPKGEVQRLIKQLGDDSFQKREETKRLGQIGEPALGALREAVANSEDLEVRRRAGILAAAFETRREYKIFQGKWLLTSAERGRRALLEPPVTITVVDDKMLITGLFGNAAGEIQIDASKRPKTIDILFSRYSATGRALRGIYVLAEESLTICLGSRRDGRPTTMDPEKNPRARMLYFERKNNYQEVLTEIRKIMGTQVKPMP